MSIPLKLNERPEPQSEDTKRKLRKSIAGLRVLLAEDVEMVRDLITILLSRELVTVTAVTDGLAAVNAAQSQDFDIIILDVQMPVMGGLDATRRIRESGGYGATVPILALTANVTRRDISKCQAAGMDGHVPKPFTPEELVSVIKSVLPDEG